MFGGTCKICQCDDAHPCRGGCAWADADRTVCTKCVEAQTLAERFLYVLGRCCQVARPPIPVTPIAWAALGDDQQQLLIMATRAIIQQVESGLAEDLDGAAVDAIGELAEIERFLTAHCPQALAGEDAPTSDVVIRLLTPHLGSRIIVPGGARM